MNNRGMIVLILLFFAGLIGLYWVELSRVPDRATRRLAEGRILPELVSTRPEEVRRIEVDGGSERLVFERKEAGRWQMVSPVDAAADPSLVETLALNLKEMVRVGDVPAKEESVSEYGLAPPRRVVRVFGEGKTPLAVLEVGSEVRDKRYVRPEGGPLIEVVDAKALAAVELPATRWRDRMLLRFSTFSVDSVAVDAPGRSIRVDRSGDYWTLRAPFKAIADDARVDGMLGELSSIRVADGADGFVEDGVKDLARYGLNPPEMTIRVTPKAGKGEPETLHLGRVVEAGKKGAGRSFARRDDQDDVVLIDAGAIRDFGASPLKLHGKKVVDLKPNRVTFLRLTAGDSSVTAARTDKGWLRLAPLADRADSKLIQEFLTRLDEADASLLFDEKTAPDPRLSPPTATLEAWRDAGAIDSGVPATPPSLKLKIGRVDPLNKTVYLQVEGDPIVLAVPTSLIEGLSFGPLALRDRQVAALATPSIQSIQIKGKDSVVSIRPPASPRDATGWRLDRPIQAPADPEGIGRLLQTLANLRAASFTTDRPESDAKYGLDKPALTVSWSLRPEAPAAPLRPDLPSESTLTIGGPAPSPAGARYARISSSPIVFVLPPEVVATFEVEFRDRRVLPILANGVESIAAIWPSLTLTGRPLRDVQTKVAEWTLVDPPAGIDFESGRFKPLVAALSGLMTFKFRQYGGPIAPETGLFPGRLVFKIKLDDGSTRTLRIGAKTADGYLLATTEIGPSGMVFLLPLSNWDAWLKPPGSAPPR